VVRAKHAQVHPRARGRPFVDDLIEIQAALVLYPPNHIGHGNVGTQGHDVSRTAERMRRFRDPTDWKETSPP
jgi:hypothetical protein